MSLHLGVDEAGRGPVLGPLVVCGCAAEEGRIASLAALGVADSKLLAPATRRRLAAEIRRVADRIVVRVLSPEAVDAATRRGELNRAEAEAMVSIIREVGPAVAQLDGLTSRPRKFGREIAAVLAPLPVRVVSESRADGKYPLVQAASIIAKVTRDDALDALREAHGDIGSGYPGDPRTIAFLRRCLALGELPPFVRRSWRTVARLSGEAF